MVPCLVDEVTVAGRALFVGLGKPPVGEGEGRVVLKRFAKRALSFPVPEVMKKGKSLAEKGVGCCGLGAGFESWRGFFQKEAGSGVRTVEKGFDVAFRGAGVSSFGPFCDTREDWFLPAEVAGG